MRKVTAILFALLFLAFATGESNAGHYWKFSGKVFSGYTRLPHSIAMDGQGKLWIDNYAYGMRYCSLYVFNTNGVQVPFSPISVLTLGAKNDTVGNGRGLARDLAGNIVWGGTTYHTDSAGVGKYGLFRINSATGALMSKVLWTQCPSQPGIDEQGNVWVAGLIPTWSMEVWDSTLAYKVGTPIVTGKGYARSTTVSPDGKRVWAADSMYTSATGSAGFFDDYYGDAAWSAAWGGKTIESHAWDRSGNLWISVKLTKTYYCIDKTTLAVIDSLKSDPSDSIGVGVTAFIVQPHGIAFSVTGDTAFVADFVANGSVKMFVKTATSVGRTDFGVPESYTLSQNFPNPFNPSTEIQFSIPKGGFTTVKVYDMLGKEVATLVEENLNPGSFTTKLDGSNLASGTYLYRLVSGATVITKKMMLLK